MTSVSLETDGESDSNNGTPLITPLTLHIGAEISGVDLSRPMTPGWGPHLRIGHSDDR